MAGRISARKSTRLFALLASALVAGSLAGQAQAAFKCFGKLPTISGTSRNDVLVGTPGPDVIVAWRGGDQIDGRGGNDLICAGPGEDFALGRGGADKLRGGLGHDELWGGKGDDLLSGGRHFDLLGGNGGADIIRGGRGGDRLTDGSGTDIVRGGPGPDIFDPFGDRSQDLFGGGTGDDDEIGFAFAEGPASFGPVMVDLATHEANGFGHDTLFLIEVVFGTEFNDTLLGNTQTNLLFGDEGNDHIEGREGNDFLDGGPGSDFLDGGDGSDKCRSGATVLNCEIL